jgi:hypothetical protein
MSSLIKNIHFGRLQIDIAERGVQVQLWNFMSGRRVEFGLSAEKFGRLQDFGLTLEHLFLLFTNHDDIQMIGFDSTRNVSFLLN